MKVVYMLGALTKINKQKHSSDFPVHTDDVELPAQWVEGVLKPAAARRTIAVASIAYLRQLR